MKPHANVIKKSVKYNQASQGSSKMRCAYADLICILGITILIIIHEAFPGIHLPMRWWENVQPGKGTIGHFFRLESLNGKVGLYLKKLQRLIYWLEQSLHLLQPQIVFLLRIFMSVQKKLLWNHRMNLPCVCSWIGFYLSDVLDVPTGTEEEDDLYTFNCSIQPIPWCQHTTLHLQQQ